jgi:hypothetical protein
MSWSATISSSSPSSGASFCLFSRMPRYSSGAMARPGTLAALGLVDGLPAPGFAQVAAEGFTEVGQRQLPLRPQARDLSADGFFDAHPSLPSVTPGNDNVAL